MPSSVGKPIGIHLPLDLGTGTAPQFIAGTATTYNQALTGALSFVGAAPLFSMQRSLAGALSFVGALTKSPSRLLTAALSFTGAAILAAITRLLAAGFQPTGTLKRASARSLAGALSFVGAAPLAAITRSLAAALSFSGSLKRSTARLLLASITPTGILSATKAFVRSLVGATLHPTATLANARAYARTIAGALTFIGGTNLYPDPDLYPSPETYPYGGAILFRLFRALPAALHPVATLTDNAAQSLLFTAVLQPQVVFLKTSARVILSAALMTTAFSAQKISSTVGKALFAGLRNAGALSSIHNPGSAEHGGGGWGVPMPDSYFQRYKPTLRRQRMKV